MASNHEQLEPAAPTYDELQGQHQLHEERLEVLKQKAWLTPDEEVEEKTIKKLKLRIKDKMASLRLQRS